MRSDVQGRAQLSGGGVDAAELLGEGGGAFGLAAVGQEAAGLPAHPLLGMPRPDWSPMARSSPLWPACPEPALAVALVGRGQHGSGTWAGSTAWPFRGKLGRGF
jgi:hypothetical protein